MMANGIERFLDEEGRLKQWPAKQSVKEIACAYLAGKFEYDVHYTEQEVNAVVASWHTFGDYSLLRRAMIESGWLRRTPDGSQYWKNTDKQSAETANPGA